jgi:phage virion morphogenesis protein
MSQTIIITGLDEVNARLGTLSRELSDMQPTLDEIGNELANITDESFENQKTPWGEAWTPNAQATIDEYVRKKGKGKSKKKQAALAADKLILIDSGQLRTSVTHEATKDSVTLSAGKIYARIHQLGGEAGRGKSVSLPARPYMPLKDEKLDEGTQKVANDMIMQRLIEAVAKSGGIG